MKVYVFGNEDVEFDRSAIDLAKDLGGKIEGLDFIYVKPNEDLPFAGENKVFIMDVVEGIKDVEIIENADLENISLMGKTSAHDFDLGFQLRYLKKIGKIGEVTIIGLPMGVNIDYLRIQSILRKLVAQDIQGS